MAYRKKRAGEDRNKVCFKPVIFYDEELSCMVKIDGWFFKVRRPGYRPEIEEFGVNLSYSEGLSIEPKLIPVKRYDCKHYYVEKHEFWVSKRARRIREWEGKPLSEVLRLARNDLKNNYATYISKMRKRKGSRK